MLDWPSIMLFTACAGMFALHLGAFGDNDAGVSETGGEDDTALQTGRYGSDLAYFLEETEEISQTPRALSAQASAGDPAPSDLIDTGPVEINGDSSGLLVQEEAETAEQEDVDVVVLDVPDSESAVRIDDLDLSTDTLVLQYNALETGLSPSLGLAYSAENDETAVSVDGQNVALLHGNVDLCAADIILTAMA